jgi:phosphoribosylamine--glycine ligase
MKIAMSSTSGIGAWFVLRLLAEGHEVDYYLSDPKFEDVLSGLIPTPHLPQIDKRRHIAGYGFPSYKKYDLSLFDFTESAKWAEASHLDTPTFGDGKLENSLENDREFGLQLMEESGINVPPYQRFDSPVEAKVYIKKTDARFVYKPFTGGTASDDKAITYVSKSSEDLLGYIDVLWERSKKVPFILQEFIKGTEMGTAGYFNGEEFFLLTGTLEEKKFMNDNKGPNTGCSGNIVYTLSSSSKIYRNGLSKVSIKLKEMGFKGIIDLNTIVTDDKIYGLEWTPRFGYFSDPTIATMYGHGFGNMLHSIMTGKIPELKWEYSFGTAVTLTMPPYPIQIRTPNSKGIKIEGVDPEDIDTLCSTYLYDAMLSKNKKYLETSGNYGLVAVPIGVGNSFDNAFTSLSNKVNKIQMPDMQYRTDIAKSTAKRYQFLEDNGWL